MENTIEKNREVKLIMVFKDAQGYRLVRSIRNPDETKTRKQIAIFMLRLIAEGHLRTRNGPVVRIAQIMKLITSDWEAREASACQETQRPFVDIPREFYQSYQDLTIGKILLMLVDLQRRAQGGSVSLAEALASSLSVCTNLGQGMRPGIHRCLSRPMRGLDKALTPATILAIYPKPSAAAGLQFVA